MSALLDHEDSRTTLIMNLQCATWLQ